MKKRILSLLLALALICSLLPVTMGTAEESTTYDLWLAGTQVTSGKAGDVLGNGVFSYDPNTNTLTVKGDCESDTNVILNRIPDLTILVAEDSSLTTSDADTIVSYADFRITGPGELTLHLNYPGHCIRVLDDATLTIEKATVDAGGYCAIFGGNHSGTLIVRGSSVYAACSGPAICGLGNIILDGCWLGPGLIRDAWEIKDASDEEAAKTVEIGPVYYDLMVAGTQVLGGFTDDILGDGGFSYDPETKTLYVSKGLSVEENGIVNGIDGLTVYVEQDVTFDLSGALNSGIITGKDLRITGPGQLKLLAEGSGISVVQGATLTLLNARVYALGEYGITGSGLTGSETLVIQNSAVRAVGNRGGIVDFKGGIELQSGTITEPEGGRISLVAESGKYAVTDAGGSIVQNVMIQKPATYDLQIGGTLVTDANAADVLGNGVFSYDPKTNTLTVSGEYENPTYYVLSSRIPNLTLYVAQDSRLSSVSGASIMSISENMTITGPGRLTLENTEGSAIWVHGGNTVLTVRDTEIEASGKQGIEGTHDDGVGLRVIASDLRATATTTADNEGAICHFASVWLQNCELTGPEGVTRSATGYSFYDADGKTAKEVVIEQPKYRLWVADKQVKRSNADDILGDGVFSYDPKANVLSVDGDCAYKGVVISNAIPGLTIRVAGDSTLSCESNVIITVEALTITGPGKLTAETSKGSAVTALESAALTLDNAVLDITGDAGITGYAGTEKLVIRSSELRAAGKTGAIRDFKGGIELEGCEIVQPDGGRLEAERIVDKDGETATLVEIAPFSYGLSINGKAVTEQNAADVLGDGVFSFDPESKTLTVKNPDGAAYEHGPIESSLPGLTIRIVDPIELNSDGHGLILNADATITGTADLKLYPYYGFDKNNYAILVQNGATLTLKNANVYAGSMAADAVKGSGAETLVVENSRLFAGVDTSEEIAPGKTGAAISGFAEIRAVGCELTRPEGGSFDTGTVLDATGEPVRSAEFAPKGELVNPFADVFEGKYYYDAVLWAFYHKPEQITNGVDDTHFAPDATCTRGQIVTFLWRAKGCPEPKSAESPFKDVTNPKAFYYKAVLWAVENGITNGVTADEFKPNDPCTRGQVVTFLWRADGKPAPESAENPFIDVETGKFFYDAVLWAYHHTPEQITNGMDATHFAPEATCTRGQIVTFLYRDLK